MANAGPAVGATLPPGHEKIAGIDVEGIVSDSFSIASGEASLAAEAAGAGQAVVFLHAGVADRRMWRAQLAALAADPAGFRAVAYDRRGFGDTIHVDEPYSHVRDLVAVLDAVSASAPAILVGSSQGGRIAIDAALAHPSRIRALVLVAPAIGGAPEAESFPPAIEAWIERMERAEADADIDRINELEAHAWLDGPLAPEGRVGGAVRELFLAMNDIALRAEPRGTEIEPPPAYGRLQDIAMPVLLIWGDLDFENLADLCRHAAARMRDARTVMLAGAAHLPSLERPLEFNRLLLEFCRSVPAKAVPGASALDR